MRSTRRIAAPGAAVLTALALALAGCGGDRVDLPEGVVAQVGDSTISAEELERAVAQRQVAAQQMGAEVPDEGSEEFLQLRRQALDTIVLQRVVGFEARSCGEPCAVTDEEVTEQLEEVKEVNFGGSEEDFQEFLEESQLTEDDARQILRAGLEEEKLFEHVTRGVRFTAEDAREYYDENPDEFEQAEQRTVSHILVESEQEARDLHGRVTIENFADLAEEHSIDPGSAEQGGSLGAIQPGAFVPEFEEAAFDLSDGEISEPVETQFGWHIISVEVEPGRTIPFSEARESIMQGQLQSARQEAFAEWRDEVVEKWRDRTTYADSGLRPPDEPPAVTVAPDGEQVPPEGAPAP